MKNIFIITAMLICSGSVFAAENYSYQQNVPKPAYNPSYYSAENNYKLTNNTLKGSIVTVPAGQEFRAVMAAPISSGTAVVGQNVAMFLGSDFYYNGARIAPAGSTINGSVIEVSKAKHGSLNGKLTLRFTQIITPTGSNIPISAVIKTTDFTGTLIGGSKIDVAKEYTKDVLVGAGAGALTGVIVSPIAGGNIGRGTALSTAVGAGGGLVKSLWDKGAEVEIPANSSLELILTQPITVNPENKSFGQ
ncbi:MAG: TrbI/VirB10 family protein [Muribaculaceae bacterium]|nr:TrbI/VirB10 family protein [Muribaculaceae bacterium]